MDTCLACNLIHIDYHHVKSRGAGGCDGKHNLMPLCRRHHVQIHKLGLNNMVSNYSKIRLFLYTHGYEYDEIRNKYYYPIKSDG